MNHIKTEKAGQVGYITLDRPKALNSLTLDMIRAIHAAIIQYENDSDVDVIILRSSHQRAFCAGGDMKATRELAINNQWQDFREFFEVEYDLNLHISRCSKPYLSLVSGVAMGGGLGLTVHGKIMVVCETTKLAMPETAIGFFPDVGGTYFLSRLPYDAGLWLALTGMPVNGEEAVSIGLASHYVTSAKWQQLTQSLEQQGRIALQTVLPAVAIKPDDQPFSERFKQRQQWFTADSDQALINTLQQASNQNDDAAVLLEKLNAASPYAVAVTRRLLQQAKPHDLEKCLQLELAAGEEVARHPDFAEGIRAVLIDKDKPVWASDFQ